MQVFESGWIPVAPDDLQRLSDDVRAIERTLSTVEGKLDGCSQQADAERDRARLRRLVKPAGYLVVGAVGAYLVVLVAAVLATPEVVTGVVLAGIGALLGLALGIGLAIYAYGGNLTETCQTVRGVSTSEPAD